MRTLWVATSRWPVRVLGDPARQHAARPRGGAPRAADLAEEFDEVAAELARTLDAFKVPAREKDEVLAAFAAHKAEVTAGYRAAA